ncbi:MAG TPA: DUF6448 family protein [Terriglobales bacterium]|nr:DUF6448 family protein [Terriglobales bacterium]
MRKIASCILFLLFSVAAFAHCDGLDGPVVKAARAALAAKNANLVLIWVQPSHETELREAFQSALKAAGSTSEEAANHKFFETAVRLHRAGEGAEFDGLKPAGNIPAPLVAADRALELRSPDMLLEQINADHREKVRQQFQKVVSVADYRPDDVSAGREYVHQYVVLLHLVEHLTQEAAPASAHDHQ